MNKILSIVSLIRDYRKYFVQSLVVSIIFIFLGIPSPYLTKLLIDNVYPSKSFSLLYFIVLATFFLAAISSLISFFHSYFMASIGSKISIEIRLKLYEKLQKLTFNFYDTHKTGEIGTRFSALQASVDGIVSMFNTIILSVFSIVLFLPILLWLEWRLTLISLLSLPIELYLMYYSGKKLKEKNKIATEQGAEVSAKLYESLNSLKTIKSLCMETKFYNKNSEKMHVARDATLIATLVNQLFSIVFSFLGNISSCIIMLIGWGMIIRNELSLGTLMAFSSYISNVRTPLKSLVNLISTYQQLVIYIDRFNEYYNSPPEVNIGQFKEFEFSTIEMQNVCFNYVDGQNILYNINFKITAGDKILIHGQSGIGKTTLIQLFVRFYEISSGVILLDDYSISEIDLAFLREKIIYVIQEPQLFNDSLLNNLLIDSKLYSENEIVKVSEICCASDFIKNLPSGINSDLYEKGQNLSVGQKQRISLMRALLRDPKILILDESTSAIDLITERKILNNINIYYPQMTLLMISHRTESHTYFNKIYNLTKDGLKEIHTSL